jgi:GPH family glycoside/pentoside/hexuronide:cation symporter
VSRGERLSRLDLFVFSSPVILFQAIELVWRTYLPSFFAATLALPIASVGMLLLAARLFDGLIDPFVGWASDRFPTRFGMRRPWMAAGAPLIVIGGLGLFWAVPGTSIATLAAWSLVFHLGYTLTATPHGGWGLELSRDKHERVRVMGAKVWVAMAGMILTLLLPSLLERGFGLGRAAQVGALGMAILLLAPLTAALVLRRIPEPDVPATRPVVNPFALFASMLRSREMRRILMLYALVGTADAAAAGTFLFFVEQALALKGWGSTLMLVQAVVPLGLLPLWARATRRLGKRRTLLAAYGWQALVAPLALLLPAGSLIGLILWLAARSLSFGVDYMLLRAMVGDITRREMEEGHRSASSRYALFNVTLRLAMGFGIAAALGALGWTGFTPGEPASDEALFAIRAVYALPAAIAALGACALLLPETRLSGLAGGFGVGNAPLRR